MKKTLAARLSNSLRNKIEEEKTGLQKDERNTKKDRKVGDMAQ